MNKFIMQMLNDRKLTPAGEPFWDGMSWKIPVTEQIEYLISANTMAYDFSIEGKNLAYVEIGPRYGMQCAYPGDHEKYKLIDEKLKQVAELMKDIHKLNQQP